MCFPTSLRLFLPQIEPEHCRGLGLRPVTSAALTKTDPMKPMMRGKKNLLRYVFAVRTNWPLVSSS